jgi:hypothetical protein
MRDIFVRSVACTTFAKVMGGMRDIFTSRFGMPVISKDFSGIADVCRYFYHTDINAPGSP